MGQKSPIYKHCHFAVTAPKAEGRGFESRRGGQKSPEVRAFFFSSCGQQSRQRVKITKFTEFLLHCVSNSHLFHPADSRLGNKKSRYVDLSELKKLTNAL